MSIPNIENQLKEAYNHIKPYIESDTKLPEMCRYCEDWCGKKHDYENCLDMQCFKFYLAYVYLDWRNHSDGY